MSNLYLFILLYNNIVITVMNNLLFYTLIGFLIYLFFFNQVMVDKFTNLKTIKSKKECSEMSMNDAIYNYNISGKYVR